MFLQRELGSRPDTGEILKVFLCSIVSSSIGRRQLHTVKASCTSHRTSQYLHGMQKAHTFSSPSCQEKKKKKMFRLHLERLTHLVREAPRQQYFWRITQVILQCRQTRQPPIYQCNTEFLNMFFAMSYLYWQEKVITFFYLEIPAILV